MYLSHLFTQNNVLVFPVPEHEGQGTENSLGLLDLFLPLLTQEREPMANWVMNATGSRLPKGFCPRLFFEAFRSERIRVVDEALSWAPVPEDARARERFRVAVEHIFTRDSRKLRARPV